MPRIDRRICNKHGIYSGNRCPECKALQDKTYNKASRNLDATSFYNSTQWKKVRKQILIRDGGLCVRCGGTSKRMIVDHIIPLEIDYSLRLRLDNLQTLCNPCHNAKTQEDENKYRGRV